MGLQKNNIVLEKSLSFAVRIVRLYQHLSECKCEYVLSKQLLRCGTSVGANLREAVGGQSREDFIAKLHISLKEIYECEYWLELMFRTNYLTQKEYDSIGADCIELAKLLTRIVKNCKQNAESEAHGNC